MWVIGFAVYAAIAIGIMFYCSFRDYKDTPLWNADSAYSWAWPAIMVASLFWPFFALLIFVWLVAAIGGYFKRQLLESR